MGDSTRKSKSAKKTKNSIGCLLLRRSMRRANSEPPKGKRFEREKTRSARTLKPRKIPRDEAYSEPRHSESDSGFLSFESIGSKRSNASYTSMNRMTKRSEVYSEVQDERSQSESLAGNEGPTSYDDNNRGFNDNEPDIVDLNDNNFAQCYQQNRLCDSDRVSVGTASVCLPCFCLPKIFKSRNSSNRGNKVNSTGSLTQKFEDSLFDLRGSSLLQTISDLRSSIAESDDKDQCFLKLVYNEHCCVDPGLCNKEKFAALNSHLRTLVDCMPRSFCECESKTNWTNYILNDAGYVSQRRNAVCETHDQQRETICKAFCSFMTLKALLRYDLL